MATTGRQTKGARKGPPEPTVARWAQSFLIFCNHPPPHQTASSRTPAWTGARGSPTYSPSTASPRQHPTQAPPIQNSFPPLAQINGARQDNPRDRVLQALSGLTVRSYILIYLSLICRYLVFYLGYDCHSPDQNFSTLWGCSWLNNLRGRQYRGYS